MTGKSRYIPQVDEKASRLTKSELATLVGLKRKKGRRESGLFLAEGVRLLEEAVKFKRLPTQVFVYPPDVSERGERLLAAFRGKHIQIQTVSSRDFHRIADTEQPQGIVAVFRLPGLKFDVQRSKKNNRALIVENISDPGNLGSLIRSALGFRFPHVLFLGDCVEPFSPKVIRSSAGAVFGVELFEISYTDVRDMKKGGATVLVTDLHGEPEDKWLAPAELTGAVALAVCSESEGASDELNELASRRIRISHSPALESLNAGFAGAIAMHRIYLSARKVT